MRPFSLRIWLAFGRDPDVVVGKTMVSSWQFGTGHVACGAFPGTDPANLGSRLGTGRSFRMAGLALCVVMGGNAINGFVWIMTGSTTDSRVIHVETLAVGQPVRLKANIADAVRPVLRHVFPGAVTLPAELRAFLGAHARQLLHPRQLPVAVFQTRDVIVRYAMALLARNAW